MEPTPMVIGISLRSARLAQRERFLMSASQRAEALVELGRSEAIDEVIVVSHCNGTEFVVWTQDASAAANSVLRYLTRSINLKMTEWSNYYRLVGDAAVSHVVHLAAGTDAVIFGDPAPSNSLLAAWQQAQRADTTGRLLDAMMTKTFAAAARIRQELGIATKQPHVAEAAVEVCRDACGDLNRRRVVVLGAGAVAQAVVREFQAAEAGAITVVNRTWDRAQHVAQQYKVKAAHAESLWEQVLRDDVVISAVSECVLLRREELEIVLRERGNKRIVLVDLSVPRSVDPNVGSLDSVTLYDLDSLCSAMDQREPRRSMMPLAARTIAAEAAGFRTELLAESVLPTIAAMRRRLEAICEQEMDHLTEQFGPFTADHQVVLRTLSAHIAQRISVALARQLKEMPGQNELTDALQQLFQLEPAASASPKPCD